MVGEQPSPTLPRRGVQRIGTGSPHLRLNNGSVSSEMSFRSVVWIETLSPNESVGFFEEHQRREENSQGFLEQRLAQFRHEFTEAMTEIAMSFVQIHQEFHGRGARFEQLRTLADTHLIPTMDKLQTELENAGARVAQVTREHQTTRATQL